MLGWRRISGNIRKCFQLQSTSYRTGCNGSVYVVGADSQNEHTVTTARVVRFL